MPGSSLRGFAKHFTNLTPQQRNEFERVLEELDNSKEITSLETSLTLLRRKVNQNLPIPQPTARPTVRGAIIEWPPLPDQRINFYEIDVSEQSNFASFSTVETLGISVVLDGITGTRFVRVRGVRRDGTTSPYSESLQINPDLFDITAHSQEAFYVNIEGVLPNVVLGGPSTTLEYTPINPNGNSMVWGFISTYGDPAVGLFGVDDITIKLYSKILSETGIEKSDTLLWELSCGEFHNSQSIGPVVLSHPELNEKIQLRLEVQDKTVGVGGVSRLNDSTEVRWAHLNVLELGID